MRKAQAVAAMIAIAVGMGSLSQGHAQPFRRPFADFFQGRVTLGCVIRDQKIVNVLNTTGQPIAAATEIYVDVVLIPTGQHRALVFHTGIPAGAVFMEGTEPASSCTAWFLRPLVAAPF